jgi:hypothetical protein
MGRERYKTLLFSHLLCRLIVLVDNHLPDVKTQFME